MQTYTGTLPWILIIGLLFPRIGFSQEYPKSLVQLIQPGTSVLVSSAGESGLLRLTIFSPEQILAVDALKTKSVEQVVEDFPWLLEDANAVQGTQPIHNTTVSRSLVAVRASSTSIRPSDFHGTFATIIHRGSDYFVMEFESGRRHAIPVKEVTRITWANNADLIQIDAADRTANLRD